MVNQEESLRFIQSDDGLDHWCDNVGFIYDISFPEEVNKTEIIKVSKEIFNEDSYNLSSITQLGDVWVDVGCHVGLFSIAAMQAGAQVGVVVDMNPYMLWAADVNTRLFASKSSARGLYPNDCVDPYSYIEEVSHVDQLIELSRMCSTDFFPNRKRTCLKLDIQGSEKTIFADTNLNHLAEHFDLMVFEYHADDLDVMSLRLENAGWHIEKIQKHFDTLLYIDTYLVWAVSG